MQNIHSESWNCSSRTSAGWVQQSNHWQVLLRPLVPCSLHGQGGLLVSPIPELSLRYSTGVHSDHFAWWASDVQVWNSLGTVWITWPHKFPWPWNCWLLEAANHEIGKVSWVPSRQWFQCTWSSLHFERMSRDSPRLWLSLLFTSQMEE